MFNYFVDEEVKVLLSLSFPTPFFAHWFTHQNVQLLICDRSNLSLEFWNAKVVQGASEPPVREALEPDVAAGDGGVHRPAEAEYRLEAIV